MKKSQPELIDQDQERDFKGLIDKLQTLGIWDGIYDSTDNLEHLACFVDVVADTMDIDDVERMQFAWLALGHWRATLALGYAKGTKDKPYSGWLECLDEFVEPEFNKLLEMIREYLNGDLEKKPVLLN